MNNNLNSATSVYVDINALNDWNSRFNRINEDSIESLRNLLSIINSLNDVWVGNIASGFMEDSTQFVQSIQKSHNDMKSVASFLIDVSNNMSSL